MRGKLYIVGIGPGGEDHITPAAIKAIRESEVVIGYSTYIDLVRNFLDGKEIYQTGMTREVERCKKAIEIALSGKRVSIISSGDPGIYAMAGLVFELLRSRKLEAEKHDLPAFAEVSAERQNPEYKIDILVIPGIPALATCASRVGAPLMHDFASISLSDRLTPWDTIEKRVHAAAEADFVIVIYNPRSRGRRDHLERAIRIILEYRDVDTPVGIVKAAYREAEEVIVTRLTDLPYERVDMQSTVIVGNSRTFIWDGWIITPRGYEDKYNF
jgi:precorrin-3B methylase